MKDVNVLLPTSDYDANSNFIGVASMKFWNNRKKIMNLKCSNKNSYFNLRSDFSNVLELLGKFSTLINSMSKSFEWKHLFFETNCVLNYVEYYKRSSPKFVYVYARDDFENFDVLEKYDFIIIEKTKPSSNNRITFDGELLETDEYIIKFISRPKFSKFDVNLDNKINNITFEVPYDFYTSKLISRYIHGNSKYDIYFKPTNIEFFLYLKALNDISWFDKGISSYTETDLLTKMYNI